MSGLRAFLRSAETLSFVKAGRLLGISPSAAGKSVARLEEHLGVSLIQRTTRRLSLTAEGTLFFERCRKIVDDLNDAEAMIVQSGQAPRGKLKLAFPTVGYHVLVPHLASFARLYPAVDLDVDFDDRIVDIVGEGFDAVVRSGDLPDSRLMSRKLGAFRFVLAAAPAYLALRGKPERADDLFDHACLRFRFPASGRVQDWALSGRDAAWSARLPTSLICNNMEAIVAAARAGLGVALMPEFLAAADIESGALMSLLPSDLGEGTFWLLWPAGRQASPKVRAFIDFACQRFLTRPGAP